MTAKIITFKDIKRVGAFNSGKGVYVMHNGIEFKTIEEVKAFILGLEYAKHNANIGMETVIENSLMSLRDKEICLLYTSPSPRD